MENREQQILSEIKTMMASIRIQLEKLDAKMAELQQVVDPEDLTAMPIDLEIDDIEMVEQPVEVLEEDDLPFVETPVETPVEAPVEAPVEVPVVETVIEEPVVEEPVVEPVVEEVKAKTAVAVEEPVVTTISAGSLERKVKDKAMQEVWISNKAKDFLLRRESVCK